MIAMAPNFTILVIGRILSSAAASLIIVKVLALTAMLTIPKNRGKMIGVVYTGFSGANIWRPNRYDDWGCNRLEIYVLIYYYCECDSWCTDDGIFTINIRIKSSSTSMGFNFK